MTDDDVEPTYEPTVPQAAISDDEESLEIEDPKTNQMIFAP